MSGHDGFRDILHIGFRGTEAAARQTLVDLGLSGVIESHPAKTTVKIYLVAVPADPTAAAHALIEKCGDFDAWCWDEKWISFTGAVDTAQRMVATLGHTENLMFPPQVTTVVYLQATPTNIAVAHTAFLSKRIVWWAAPRRGVSSTNPGEPERTS